MNRISIFCGSSSGTDKAFENKAFEVGQVLAEKNIGIVYGGANVGLMAAVADGALSKDGCVIGVIPKLLKITKTLQN